MRAIEQIREAARRRGLTAAEAGELREHLSRHPGERESWQEELALTSLLQGMPDAPLSSNFTARVLQEIELPAPREASFSFSAWLDLRRWLPRLSAATLVVALSLSGWSWHRNMERADLAASLSDLSREIDGSLTAARIPPVEVLQDFDVIGKLGPVRGLADEELLDALQQK
jgi:hypothetical protein